MERAGQNAQPSSGNSARDWLSSPAFAELQHAFADYREQSVREDAVWWESLSYEDRLKAFRCVCRRIYQGDVKERGSYRHVLYETFGFEMDAYMDGMDCGYMTIHNLIWQGIEKEQNQDLADEGIGLTEGNDQADDNSTNSL
jgi:hypothetical protein